MKLTEKREADYRLKKAEYCLKMGDNFEKYANFVKTNSF
jgi:hypothetical protein